MKTCLLILIIATFNLFGGNATSDSIVKISATLKEYDYKSPWCPPETCETFASGFVIDGNQIITNAHAVDNASFIQVRSATSNELFEAYVKVIGHDCDLALLEVEDETFFEGRESLKFRETLLQQSEEVQVHGFPMGGNELSITKGIVSRSEITQYAHSGIPLLTTQIDAPINGGNSGGPVFSGKEVVGIAHQVLFFGQNIGYMIPIPVIHHFLEEVGTGGYEGFPRNNLAAQSIRNKAMRQYYGLGKDVGGVLVVKVPKKHFFDGVLKAGDILLEMDGCPIDVYGRIKDEELGLSLSYNYLIMKKHFGDEITLLIIREGERVELSAFVDPEKKGEPIVPMEFDKSPTYYIAGGFVFQPLVKNLLYDMIDLDLGIVDLYTVMRDNCMDDRDEVVVLSRVLNDAVNSGYQSLSKKIVEKVNGKVIRSLKDLIETIETSMEPFLIIEMIDHIEMVLDREAIKERTPKILNRYQISYDRSSDLR